MERRWDEPLRALQLLEAEFDRFTRTQPRAPDEGARERIRRLAEEAPALWRASTTTAADRPQVVRLLVDRVVLTVDPDDDRVAVRVEWAGGTVREQTIHREIRGYKNPQSWPRLSARLATLHGRGETPKAIAAILDQQGFRPPKRASRFTAGMVRRLLHELGLRERVSRSLASAAVLSPDERWLHDLARLLAVSPHTLHGWRKRGWMLARQIGGRGGPWAVWADPDRAGPPAGLAGLPAFVGRPGAVGGIAGAGTTSWMTRRPRPDAREAGPVPHTTCFLEGTVPDASRTRCIGSWT